jgi:uncharacterized repeat protein (TIGR01451 family)
MFRLSKFAWSVTLMLTLTATLALSFAKLATAQYPGTPIPASSEAGDFRAGSILFYNLYHSTTGNAAEDTVIALTNTNATTGVLVRLFFVEGASGSVINRFVSLGARQTVTLLASEVDPGVRGYLMAVAVDGVSRCPIQFNHLMGEAAVKFASGHKANLSAVAVAALNATPAACGGNTATVSFDGVSYNQLPRVLALDNFGSIADGYSTMIAVHRVGGDLSSGANTTGQLFGILYDDATNPFSFSLSGAPQVFGIFNDGFPRTTPRLSVIVPSGRAAWLRLFSQQEDIVLLGSVLVFNPNTASLANAFNGGHNLTHRTLSAAGTYTLPLNAPDLVLSKTHVGAFTFGGTGVYTLTVTNNGTDMTASATPINLTDTLPANLTLASFSGAGWNCMGAGTANVACSIDAVLAAGASTAPLMLTVSVNGGTPVGANSITNSAAVSHPQDGNPANNSASDPTTIACQSITVGPATPTLLSGTAGTAYSQSFTQTGGYNTTSFSLGGGTLPQGLNLSAAGSLSGTPAQTGTFNFTIKATDANGCMGTQAYTLTINCGTVTLSPGTLTAGTAGAAYNQSLAASGGIGSYGFSLNSGTLPAGLNLSPAGVLAGTPTVTGSFNFTVNATDANMCAGTQAYTLVLNCPSITVNPATLPDGAIGGAYSQTVTAVGGIGPLSWSLSAGTLPPGVSLNAATGALTGTLTTAGTFGFTLRATDSNSCFGQRAYSVTISTCQALNVNPATLSNGFQDNAYNQTLTASGGTAPHTFAVTVGSLPGGLTLASGGGLTGTPTATGTFNFTVTATDANGCTGTRAYTVIVSGGGLQFYPLAAPVRALETRAPFQGCVNPGVPISGGSSFTLAVRTGCTGIPANAAAVTGNVTVVPGAAGGFLTLFPSSAMQTVVANSNFKPGEVTNNVFTTGLGAGDGAFKIFASATTEVIVDITGYYAPPSTSGLYFHPLPKPIRLLETRAGEVGCNTPGAPIQGGVGGTRTQQARLTCDGVTIPAGALAIVGNATTVGPQAGGYLTLFPANAAQPLVASSNYNAGQVVNGPFSVGLAPTGEFNIFSFATTDLVVDVLGYYSTEANDVNGAGLLFNPLPKPVRLLETRANQAVGCYLPGLPLISGVENTQPARGACDGVTIPANALGAVGNATVVTPNAAGFLTLWPSTALRPLVATANYNAGDIGNRHFIVGLGAGDGAFKLFSSATTELVIDLSGYFAP